MIGFLWGSMLVGLFALAISAGLAVRLRLRQRLSQGRPVVDDAVVRAILERGVVTTDEDEPLDLREIEEQERRFWSESWDEGDEW